MTRKIGFTQAALNKIKPPVGRREYYRDTRTPGLYLCVYPTGAKVFEYYRRMGGRPTRLAIGQFPALTVGLARRAAARMAGELAQGRNPAEKHRKARERTSLDDLFSYYLQTHAKPHKRSWREDQRQFNCHLKTWGTRKLSQIRKSDVAAIHSRIGQNNGTYAANRLLAMISTMFNHAEGVGFEGPNPAKGVKKFKEYSRDRFLSADELRAFFKALDAELDDTWRDFFTLALLTGARRSNLLTMVWPDLELDRGLWRIPEALSKNKEPLLCVLAEPAVTILRRRGSGNAEKQSKYVFPGRGKTGHATNPTRAWKRIVERAGIKDLHIHDLRRTLASWQAATDASLPVIGRSLGHKSLAATMIYARLDIAPVRKSVDAAVAAMVATTQKTLPARKAPQ